MDRIFPGVSIAGVDIGGLTPQQAEQKVKAEIEERLAKPLQFSYNGQNIALDLTLIPSNNLTDQLFSISTSVDDAYTLGRQKLFFPPKKVDLQLANSQIIENKIKQLSTQVNEPAINAQIKIEGDLVNVTPSQEGKVLDQDQVLTSVYNYIRTGELEQKVLPITVEKPHLTYENALFVKKILDQVKLNPLKLSYNDKNYVITRDDLLPLINLAEDKTDRLSFKAEKADFIVETGNIDNNKYSAEALFLDRQKVDNYLQTIASDINRDVEEPLFELAENSGTGTVKVKEFRPPQEGLRLNNEKTTQNIYNALMSNQSEVFLVVDKIPTKNRLANEMGIKELIGEGVSKFEGSIPNRVYNVELTAKKLNGTLVPPGEEFSFVNTIGDISGATGYKPAYVIKSGRTVLDDGGGVCQVSTTVFRAALNSGVPITARTAHAYRVHYYEEDSAPGIDATIFHPTVDFKFKNDTPGHILIHAYTEGLVMYVKFYGTSDGRVATLTTPVITSQTPAPPELRQDDPTLPKGQVKQVDWAAAGAKVFFSRTVKRGEETLIDEKFYSNYKPWQAVYLVGTKEG